MTSGAQRADRRNTGGFRGMTPLAVFAAIVFAAGVAHADPPKDPKPQRIVAILKVKMPNVPAAPTSQPAVTRDEIDAVWEREIQSHAHLIRQKNLATRAIENASSEIRKTDWFRSVGGQAQATDFLFQNLKVQAVPGTNLIEISIDGPKPGDAAAVVNEIGMTYVDFVVQTEKNKLYDRSIDLNNLKVRNQMRLRDVSGYIKEQLAKQDQNPVAVREIQLTMEEDKLLRNKLRVITDELELIQAAMQRQHLGPIEWAARATPN